MANEVKRSIHTTAEATLNTYLVVSGILDGDVYYFAVFFEITSKSLLSDIAHDIEAREGHIN